MRRDVLIYRKIIIGIQFQSSYLQSIGNRSRRIESFLPINDRVTFLKVIRHDLSLPTALLVGYISDFLECHDPRTKCEYDIFEKTWKLMHI